jgi:hypothetical protein
MSPDVVVAILGTGGFSAIIGAVVTGLFSKRKIGAEATDIITKAAAGVVTNMQAEIDRQVKRNDTLVEEHREAVQRLCDQHEQEMNEVRRVLQLHVAWDAIAIAKVSELGVNLPPAPPLLPPSRVDHADH